MLKRNGISTFLQNHSCTTYFLSSVELLQVFTSSLRWTFLKTETFTFTQRDLAARNLLISSTNEEEYILKITDFGLSRRIEDFYEVTSKQLPLRWTAPEVFEYGKASEFADVWSFGIVLWEIFSRGGIPYSGNILLHTFFFF